MLFSERCSPRRCWCQEPTAMSHRQGAHIATRHSQVPGVCAWTLQTQELATRSRADPTASVCNSSAAGGGRCSVQRRPLRRVPASHSRPLSRQPNPQARVLGGITMFKIKATPCSPAHTRHSQDAGLRLVGIAWPSTSSTAVWLSGRPGCWGLRLRGWTAQREA